MIPAGIRSQRYRIVTAMKAPLPRPRTMTASGRRQQSDDSTAPTHAVTPEPTAPSLMVSADKLRGSDQQTNDHATYGLLRLLGGERPVLEGQPVGPTTARNRASGLSVLGERHDFVAVRTAHPVRQGRRPATAFLANPEGMAGAIRALHQVSRSDALR